MPLFFRHVQRAVSSFRIRMTAASVGGSLSDAYGSFTRMAQFLDFTKIRRAHKAHCDNARTGKHISLTECFVISADVDSGDDKIFICFSNLWSLLSIARQINSGWDFVWHGDATFNFCRADAGLITLGHNSLGAHYQNLCWTIMGGSRETKQTYEQSYEALRRAAHLIFKLPVCCLEDCITCAAVRLSRSHAKMSAFLARDGVVPNKVLPADGANLDCGGAVVSFARETLGVDPSKCGAHITGIARKQHQHHEIFTKREAYDTFYEWLFRASKYPHPASAARLQEKIVEYFENDGAWDPTMDDMITLSESFRLCVAVPRKWAPEVRHK